MSTYHKTKYHLLVVSIRKIQKLFLVFQSMPHRLAESELVARKCFTNTLSRLSQHKGSFNFISTNDQGN
jgi:hypothetical protein